MEEEGWRGEGRAEQIGRAQERRPEENGSVGRDVASADALLPSAYAELRRYGEHAPGGLARPRRAWRLARVRALAPGLQVLAGREETEADTLRDPAGSQELSDESRRTTEQRRRRGTYAHTHTEETGIWTGDQRTGSSLSGGLRLIAYCRRAWLGRRGLRKTEGERRCREPAQATCRVPSP